MSLRSDLIYGLLHKQFFTADISTHHTVAEKALVELVLNVPVSQSFEPAWTKWLTLNVMQSLFIIPVTTRENVHGEKVLSKSFIIGGGSNFYREVIESNLSC